MDPKLDLPFVAWRMYATAAQLDWCASQPKASACHCERQQTTLLFVVNSVDAGDPLRESLSATLTTLRKSYRRDIAPFAACTGD